MNEPPPEVVHFSWATVAYDIFHDAPPCWLWPRKLEDYISMHKLFDFSDKIGPLDL